MRFFILLAILASAFSFKPVSNKALMKKVAEGFASVCLLTAGGISIAPQIAQAAAVRGSGNDAYLQLFWVNVCLLCFLFLIALPPLYVALLGGSMCVFCAFYFWLHCPCSTYAHN